MTGEKQDALATLRALAANTQAAVSPEKITEFLRASPVLAGARVSVELARETVAAGASGGIALFRLDTDNPKYQGDYVLRFSLGAGGIFQQTSLKAQFEIMQALHARGLPVAEAVWLDEAGAMGLGPNAVIMRRVKARAPQINYLISFAQTPPPLRSAMIENLMGAAAQLHRIPSAELNLDALRSRGGEGEHFLDREINWTQAELHTRFPEKEEGERARLHSEIRATLDRTADFLRARAPRDRQPVLVHGDFTLANVMFSDEGAVAALLDWELSHEGLPEEDVTYCDCSARGRALLANHAPVLPQQSALAALYGSAGGPHGGDWEYATLLSAFRLATWGALGTRRLPKESWAVQRAVWAAQSEVLAQARAALEAR